MNLVFVRHKLSISIWCPQLGHTEPCNLKRDDLVLATVLHENLRSFNGVCCLVYVRILEW
jgi:hypothetical protein